MTDAPLTPLELRENQACAAIAEEVWEHFKGRPDEASRGACQAADTIRARIADRQRQRSVAEDPFTRCLYQGCDEEALGAFCGTHIVYVSDATRLALARAIVQDDHAAYGRAVKAGRDEIARAP